ncbi:uncharacterized protein LOC106643889 [Copidosoma floridanum]|uniref:uncharacterized protein LOC106643889 n=1 Tax=Copidosoma floridanum TaxID=29053 RepID=UPI0006C9AC48|nr:uncharacterized protein LOC106643889 [Copidosoma floridanum]
MMENRAYEDEPNKSAQHLYHNSQQQHRFHQQLSLNLSQLGHHHQLPQSQVQHSRADSRPCEQLRRSSYHSHQFEQPHRFEPYRSGGGGGPMDMPVHGSDCHVYEDIVAPYGLEPGGAGAFHRNLTLPLRRTSQSCESIEGTSSSVRVTSRERTRGSIIERLARDDRNRSSAENSSRDESLVSGSSVERPARRRRKKDCKHCKVKAGAGNNNAEPTNHRQLSCRQQETGEEEEEAYEERNAELRAIFGLPGLCALAPGCLNGGVVYAIGCNGTECAGSIVSSSGGGTTNSDSTTTTALAGSTTAMPRFAGPEGPFNADDKALVSSSLQGCNNNTSNKVLATTATSGAVTGNARAAGMKVNSIYAQEHWHAAAKDPRIFLNDPKEQNCNSAFQYC